MSPVSGRRTLLAVVCAVAVATIYVAQPVLPRIGEDLGLPEADSGWIVTTGQLGYLIGLALLVPLGTCSTGANSSPGIFSSPRSA